MEILVIGKLKILRKFSTVDEFLVLLDLLFQTSNHIFGFIFVSADLNLEVVSFFDDQMEGLVN